MRRLYLVLILFCLIYPTLAIEEGDTVPRVNPEDYPTYFLLSNLSTSALDRYDLAQRLSGVSIPPVDMGEAPIREIGTTRSFRLTTVQNGGTADIEAELRAIGEHSFIWVDTAMTASDENIELFAQRFDDEVYGFVTDLWATVPRLGIDGESRIHLVFSSQVNNNVAGYFSSTNSYLVDIAPNSNQLDMMIFNGSVLQAQSLDFGISVAVHELQHLIHHQNDSNEELWVNEGFSTLTQHLIDPTSGTSILNAFANHPDVQLNTFEADNISAHYGASLSFLLYLHDRYGLSFMQELAEDPFSGLLIMNADLRRLYQTSVDAVFADWVVANIARQDDTIYGYSTLPDIDDMSLTATYNSYPIDVTGTTPQYSTHYYQLEDVPSTLTFTFEADETVALIDTEPVIDDRLLYSLRGDNANSYITYYFDLTSYDNAQLDFSIWYDLEDNWDYGYITISTDRGNTWNVLTTPAMSDTNLNGRAYTTGYTGQSDDWLAQSLDLTDYVGEQIYVRFDMVTDDGINQQGIALDDLRLVADGQSNVIDMNNVVFEYTDGWTVTNNQLPQFYWIQVIEHQADDIQLTRYAVHDTLAEWSFDTHPDTEYITLAISPFATMTTQSASYRLQVE